MNTTGLLNDYHVDYRNNPDMPDTAAISAFRVEGWREDYAFFQNADNLSEATLLIPRALVSCVRKVCHSDPEIPEHPQGARSTEAGHVLSWVSKDGALRGWEGPYPSYEQAAARSEELRAEGKDCSFG